jgi:hypothetical protein
MAEVTRADTQVTVSAPASVVKRTSVTFNGQLTSSDPRCIGNVTMTVTKPAPLSWQVGRRRIVSTDANGNFSYTKDIYRSGTWTFSFEGMSIALSPDETLVCGASTAEITIHARRR